MKEPVIVNRDKFVEFVTATFDMNELQQLCFGLNVDWDDLAGAEKQSKIIALIRHLERRERLEELLNSVKKMRPHISWPDGLAEMDDIEAASKGEKPAVSQQINITGKSRTGPIVQINEVKDGRWLKRLWQSLFR